MTYNSLFNAPRTRGTDRSGKSFDLAVVEAVWRRGQIVPGNDPGVFRKDACGAWMKRTAHGDTASKYGWEIDHIHPAARGGGDELSNLQPLQWQNNRSKSDAYAQYTCAVSAN